MQYLRLVCPGYGKVYLWNLTDLDLKKPNKTGREKLLQEFLNLCKVMLSLQHNCI